MTNREEAEKLAGEHGEGGCCLNRGTHQLRITSIEKALDEKDQEIERLKVRGNELGRDYEQKVWEVMAEIGKREAAEAEVERLQDDNSAWERLQESTLSRARAAEAEVERLKEEWHRGWREQQVLSWLGISLDK